VISISPEKWFWVAVGSYEEEAMMVQKLGVLIEDVIGGDSVEGGRRSGEGTSPKF
jgi:hypothetical protein